MLASMKGTRLLQPISGLKMKFIFRLCLRAHVFQFSTVVYVLGREEKHLVPNLIWDVSSSLVATTGWNY